MARFSNEVKELVKQLRENGQTSEQIQEIVKQKLKTKISVASIERMCGEKPAGRKAKGGGGAKDMKRTRGHGRRRAANLKDLESMSNEELLSEIVEGFEAVSVLRTKLLQLRVELVRAVGKIRKLQAELKETHQAERGLGDGA